jgi:tetratricopeptide (TPR) repeat protein
MSEDSASPASGASPDPDLEDSTLSLYAFLRQGDAALEKKAWGEAVRIYELALQQRPEDLYSLRLYYGLAQAYEGKSRDEGEPFLLKAMDQYRKMIDLDPECTEAHDGLLAAATKTQQLQGLLDEYKARLAADPSSEIYRNSFRKIEALLLMQAKPREPIHKPHRFTWMLLEVGLPLFSLLGFLGHIFFRVQKKFVAAEAIGSLLLRTSFFLLSVYLFYKVYMHFRHRN